MKKTIFNLAFVTISGILFLTACSKSEPSPIVTIITKTDSIKVNFSPVAPFTFLVLKTMPS